MLDKRGLSAVVTAVIMIALVVSAIAIVWGVVANLVEEELEGAESCVNVFEKVGINSRYTCYDSSTPGNLKFQFSLSLGDIDVEEVLFAVSAEGTTKTFSISNIAKDIPNVDNFPLPSGLIVLPGKNGGLTYVYDLSAAGFSSGPDSFEIAPTIDGKQCSSSDLLRDIPKCETLI